MGMGFLFDIAIIMIIIIETPSPLESGKSLKLCCYLLSFYHLTALKLCWGKEKVSCQMVGSGNFHKLIGYRIMVLLPKIVLGFKNKAQ